MPPIPVHIDDPITPQKPEALTPQTSDISGAAASSLPATTTGNQASPYAAARPGAAAVPAPTSAVPRPQQQPTPTRTYQPRQENCGPPPPQPGAVPSLPAHQALMTTPSSGLPPPPRAGQSIRQPPPPTTTMPSQLYMPSPQQNQAPTYTTAAGVPPPTTARQRAGPTTLNLGPVSSPTSPSASGPPGYHQNIYAQDLSPAQRASLDHQERSESLLGGVGLGGGQQGGAAGSEAVGSVWSTVKGWASVAGAKLAETEEQVWKRINGQ